MTPRKTPESQPEMLSSEKVMQTFRMPRELVTLVKAEAARKGLDMTALVIRLLHGYLTDFGLPPAATHQLDADREALGMDRLGYMVHLLYQRGLEVREKGPGFDAPSKKERKGR
jgi:hypothetical protein